MFTIIIIAFVLTLVMGYIWIERRGMARMQARLGPNRAGPFGLFQPVGQCFAAAGLSGIYVRQTRTLFMTALNLKSPLVLSAIAMTAIG